MLLGISNGVDLSTYSPVTITGKEVATERLSCREREWPVESLLDLNEGIR